MQVKKYFQATKTHKYVYYLFYVYLLMKIIYLCIVIFICIGHQYVLDKITIFFDY